MGTMIAGNRTGIGRAPERAEAMTAATKEFPPSRDGDGAGLVEVRAEYARSSEPIGTLPPPTGLKNVAKLVIGALTGRQVTLFLDKLGERLAFERTGTRLYEALLGKLEVGGGFEGGPSRKDLDHIRAEELAHVSVVEAVIRRMGGDPTAVTPSADLHAVAGQGIGQVLVDPRTSLLECLEAMLVAELVDNDAWTALIELAQRTEDDDAVNSFTRALDEEREHLMRVRTWLAAGHGRSTAAARILSAAEREATLAVLEGSTVGERVPARRSRRPARRGGRPGRATDAASAAPRRATKRGSTRRSRQARKKGTARRSRS
jgi:rubrerythrin